MEICDNLVLIGIHYDDSNNDEVVIVEFVSTDQVAHARDYPYKSETIKKSSPTDKLYSMQSFIKFNWKIAGITGFYHKKTQYIAILDESGDVHLLNVKKVKRGTTYVFSKSEEELFLKSSMKGYVKYPTPLIYDKENGSLLVASGDIYSFKLP